MINKMDLHHIKLASWLILIYYWFDEKYNKRLIDT